MTDEAQPDTQQVIAPADVYVSAIGDHVKTGDVIEVDAETAASLVAQGWSHPEPTKRKAHAEPDK
jgi:hypothetical protein